MNNFKIDSIKEDTHCSKSIESILALKVFDQCRMQKCIHQGPVISAEENTCIIVDCDDGEHLGRVILPGRPICLPTFVKNVKILDDSLQINKILINLCPSNLKKDYWDIEIRFEILFKMQLFDCHMNKLKILRCPCDCESLRQCDDFRYYVWGSVEYVQTVTLFGSNMQSSMVSASDIFLNCGDAVRNSPHVLVEAKAYAIEANIIEPDCECDFEEVCDGIYDEPIKYICITIGICMIIRLFRLVNLLVDSNGYDIAKSCNECAEDVCEMFDKIKFPIDEFYY